MKRLTFLSLAVLLLAAFNYVSSQDLKLNDLEYFETQASMSLCTVTFLPGVLTMRRLPV
jgi:hypothetical protein